MIWFCARLMISTQWPYISQDCVVYTDVVHAHFNADLVSISYRSVSETSSVPQRTGLRWQ